MVRAPCCNKVGLRKGPWTAQEDEILTRFINNHGHGNWRALPIQAGLFRCGKSCRLRWMNYLRPDIKRGNFSAEEEEVIVKMHKELGNRWSLIAARLPGRTDNEIKNIWNTRLKKRAAAKSQPSDEVGMSEPLDQPISEKTSQCSEQNSTLESGLSKTSQCSETSSTMEESSAENPTEESFWSEVFRGDDMKIEGVLSAGPCRIHQEFPYDLNMENDVDFWMDTFQPTLG